MLLIRSLHVYVYVDGEQDDGEKDGVAEGPDQDEQDEVRNKKKEKKKNNQKLKKKSSKVFDRAEYQNPDLTSSQIEELMKRLKSETKKAPSMLMRQLRCLRLACIYIKFQKMA